jgi:signal transduction histidine kinase/ligand-binding sensor domain-containing protein/DNA-binding response OmpR family regulator
MIKQIYYCFYISLFTLLFSAKAGAQENINSYLTIDNGLVNNEITTIKQDKYGFLWFGTRGGLNKYDGYNLKLLRNKPNSTNNLSSQAIETMFAGKDGLWIGTKTGGLNKYDFLSDRIYNYPLPNVIGVVDIFSLYESTNGNVYIGSSKGIYYFNYQTKKFRLVDKYIANGIVADGNGGIWVASTDGLRNYNASNKLVYQTKFGFNLITLTSIAVNKSKNIIYLGTWGEGLIVFNYKDKSYKSLLNDPKNDNSLSNNNTYRVLLDKSGSLWVGTWGGGLNQFNTQTQNFKRYVLSSADNLNYINKVVLSIEQDRSGVIWFGTEGGVYRINTQKKQFNNITYQFNKPNSLLNTNIISILKDSNKALWVGTKDGGLEYSVDDAKTFIKVNLPFSNIANTRINTIYQNGNKLWVGSNDGLFIINGLKPTDKINHYVPSKEELKLTGNKITCIIKDVLGAIWLGTQEKGLLRVLGYDKTGKPLVKIYPLSEKKGQIQSERITSMFNDKVGRLWIGTFNGLHLYNRNKDNFTNFKHDINDALSISNSIVLSITQDYLNNIWVGTPNGLNKLIEKENNISFKNYFANDNFPNDYVHAILPDKKSKIWISTNKGIASFNVITNKFNNYDIGDGLLSNAFSENAAFADPSGVMYFGGIKGITYFHPDSIKINKILPPVYFTNILVNNIPIGVGEEIEGSIPLTKALFATKSITLNYKQDLLSLTFAALDYHSSDKNQYTYRLRGFNDDWVNAGRRRNVTYTNLPAGNYVLEVKASNSDNIWNEKGAELNISILPPPWKTWWAKLIYISVFLFLLWLSRYIGLNRLRLENKLDIANISLKREKEVTEIKSKLFTNISHEFRTPLTLMVGPLDDLSRVENLNFGVRKTVLKVQDQTKRLLNLVNQLLDFQKAESGKLTLFATNSNIVSFSKEIFYSFKNEAQRRNIKFQFNASNNTINLSFDKEKMTIVLYNLLSNALKFSNDGGIVNLNINEINEQNISYCEIIVKDTGKGINENEKEKIFDRFYQVAKAEAGKFAGTGIGLAFTKDLLLLHNGKITVDSEPLQGSSFRILLPLNLNQKINKSPLIEEFEEEILVEELVEADEDIDFALDSLDEDSKPIALIIEDNLEVNDYIVSLLKPNYQTFFALNGKDGLKIALEIIPDVVISDVMMPEMNGYELCHHLKSAIQTSHIPVILLTAQSDSEAQIKGVNEGADVYLSKPFNPQVLRSHIKNILDSRKKLKELFAQKISLGPSEVEITSFEGEFIKKVISHIEENISNSDFQKDALSDEMNMSRSTFYRKLKAITGMSGSEFIRFIKIQRSAQLLVSGEFNIKQIAYEVGFNDTKHFRKCFIKQYEMTPTEYIKKEKIAD